MNRRFFAEAPLCGGLFLGLAMAALEASWWMSVFAGLVVLWKALAEKRSWPRCPGWLTGILSVVLGVLVFVQEGTLFGQEAANTLLVGLTALKIMDYQSQRDHRFLVLLGFVLVSMRSVFSLDLYWLVPSGLAFLLLWMSLMDPHFERRTSFLLRLFVTSVPMLGFLFLIFPRVVVPWAMSRSSGEAMIGFSDRMNPGSVSELASYDQLAFRAQFLDRVQSTDDLYWRGTVLTESGGLEWARPPEFRGISETETPDSDGFRYEIVLEPGSKGYLFTLNYPLTVSAVGTRVSELSHSVFRSLGHPGKSLVYQARTDPARQDDRPPDADLLQTPELPPRTREWVERTKRLAPTAGERLRLLRRFFQDPDFVYTLSPGVYQNGDLDEFLFERKRGFCEHFAGAFATLARALEIPARVVIGYHGGVYNVFGNFWRVSQRDAHAWTELYVDGFWLHQDPTDWVAPLRLTLGAEGFFSLSEQQQQALARNRQWLGAQLSDLGLVDGITHLIDHLNYRWTYFLLEFDEDSQRAFWMRLSDQWAVASLVFAVGLFAFLGVSKLILLRPRSRSLIEKIMMEVESAGEKRSQARHKSEAPRTYLLRLSQLFPRGAEVFIEISEAYDRAEYQQIEIPKKELKALQKKWRRLKLS